MNGTQSDHVLVKQSIAPQAVGSGASATGTAVDCMGYETLLVDVELGAIVDSADVSVTVKLQQSSDNGVADAFADITSATTGAVANAGQNEPYLFDVNLSECKRYIRAVATGGSSGGGLVGVSFHLSQKRHNPPTQVNTVTKIGHS
jgi:hypothetical protein